MTLVNPSTAAVLDIEVLATAKLPLATTPLSGNELLTLLQSGRNVYISVLNFIAQYLSGSWTVVVNHTAVAGEKLFVDTSGGPATVTLPAFPLLSDLVSFADYGGTWGTNNLTVARNGQLIVGLAEDMIVDVNRGAFSLVFSGVDWRLTE